MNLHHLKVFTTVCENGNNLTRAAMVLNTTQPAVSFAIREIESEFDILLFDRLNRKLSLTMAGQEFLKYAKRILSLEEDLILTMEGWGEHGVIRIGASITIGSNFMPTLVERFKKDNPNTQVHVSVFPSAILEQKLKDNSIDLALLETVITDEDLVSKAFMKDRLIVVTPNTPEYRNRTSMTLEELSSSCLLLREKGSGSRDMIDRISSENGYVLHPEWESMSTTALMNAVEKGLGITVLPYHMVSRELKEGKLHEMGIKGIRLDRSLYVVRHKDKLQSPIAGRFMELLDIIE